MIITPQRQLMYNGRNYLILISAVSFFEGRHYEVSVTPLPGFANAGKGRLVAVDDIATSLTEINAAFPQYLLKAH